jgi:hypothetical protein
VMKVELEGAHQPLASRFAVAISSTITFVGPTPILRAGFGSGRKCPASHQTMMTILRRHHHHRQATSTTRLLLKMLTARQAPMPTGGGAALQM